MVYREETGRKQENTQRTNKRIYREESGKYTGRTQENT